MNRDRYQEVGDLNVRYWQEGTGPDLLLIHGLNAMVEYWELVWPYLIKHFRVTAIDMAGFGKSSKPDVDYDLPFYSEFLKKTCDSFGFKKIYLCGHSLGGALCLQFSEDHLNRVEKLILIDSAGFSCQVTWVFRLMSIPFFCDLLMYKNKMMYEKALKLSVYLKTCITPKIVDHQYVVADNPEHKRTLKYILTHHASLRGIKKSTLKPLWSRFSLLKDLPIKVIWGDRDALLNISHTKKIPGYLPHAEVEVFKACGHIPMLEYPESCAKTMINFLLK